MTHYLRILAARLRGLSDNRKADRDLDKEIKSHLRLLAEKYTRQGMSEAEAARVARLQFGNITLLREVNREMRGFRFIEVLVQDLRFGMRMLKKNPGFTFAAVVTLALGIGANTAIFSLIDALLLRKLPVKSPEQLVTLEQRYPDGSRQYNYGFVDVERFGQLTQVFSSISATTWIDGFNIAASGSVWSQETSFLCSE